ncbi:MAG: LLM class flavin-dependent oxidoreductase [Nitrososphaerales archaeon]
MNKKTDFGVVLGSKAPPNIVKEAAKICDDSTVKSFWIPETRGYGAFSMLGYLASNTKRLLLGSGIVNVYSRSPMTMGIEAKSLLELSDGRFILGIGASAPPIVEQWHGIKFERPVKKMIQVTQILREIYGGQIYWAAVNKIMTRTAGRFADGVIFFLKPLSITEKHIECSAVNDSSRTHIISFVPTYISNDKSKAEYMARITIAAYVGGNAFYAKPLVEAGFGESVSKIRNAWASGDRTLAINSVPKELVNSITAVGTVDECIKILGGYASIGIHSVVAAFDVRRYLYNEEFLNNLRKFVDRLG